MSLGYRFYKECNNRKFDYGDFEDTFDFFFENYYEILNIYRSIIEQMKEVDEKRENAHNQLQKLRADEERWNKQGKLPNDFDAEEHQNRKDRLVELREMDYDLKYKGRPIEYNKLTYLIMNNMKLVKHIEIIDRKMRSILGPLAEKSIKIAITPWIKMANLTIQTTDSLETEDMLRKMINDIEKIPNKARSYFEV